MGLRSFVGTMRLKKVDSKGGAIDGEHFFLGGEAYPVSIQPTPDKTSVTSRMKETAGNIIATKSSLTSIDGSAVIRDWTPQTLAMSQAGSYSKRTGIEKVVVPTSGTTVTVLDSPFWQSFPDKNLTVLTLQQDTDTDPKIYVEDVDYMLSPSTGMFMILEDGELAVGDDLRYGYTVPAETGYTVDVATHINQAYAMIIDMYDEFSQESSLFEADIVYFASNAETNTISESGVEGEPLGFDLTYVTAPNKNSPARFNGVPIT